MSPPDVPDAGMELYRPARWSRYAGVSACVLLLGASPLTQAFPQTASQAPARLDRMPTLPLTQLDDRAQSADLDARAITLTFAQAVPIKDLLLLLVRGTNLSIVPDPDANGSFIGELKNVTVRETLSFVLPPLGLDFSVDGSFVRIFRRQKETRFFDINYIATERTGTARVGGSAGGKSNAEVSTSTRTDIFGDLTSGVRALVSDQASFSVDRKAGILQVTDFPERLDRVGLYLDVVQDRVHRQAQIDARIIEVELNDEKAEGIDWSLIAAQLAGGGVDRQRPARSSPGGLRVADIGRLLELLAAQGTVATVASPRVLTLNNEPAIVRTDAVVFSVTPQISGDSVVTLSLSPIVKSPARAESDLLARVADGETLVVSGFTRASETRERKTVGLGGGWFGRGTVVSRRHLELVVLLTPRIVSSPAP